MQFQLATLANGDDVVLGWRPSGADLSACFGFAIERRRNGGAVEVLKNRVSDKHPNAEPEKPQELLNPSDEYPFRLVNWTDHGVDAGDTVEYRVVAMMGKLHDLTRGASSEWSRPIALSNTCGAVSAYFNRGLVISQFAARVMREHDWTPADLKKNIGLVDNQFRRFLSGQLRTALLDILDGAAKNPKTHAYAALFELSDEELIDRLVALGPRLHVVLANGAVKKAGEDENSAARATLRAAHAEVVDRMSAPRFLGHNKFLVIAPGNKPAQVWTGSTNWQPTGLCTQINNAVLIDSTEAAAAYLDAWQRLRDAGDGHGDALLAANGADPVPIALGGESEMVARFTAVHAPARSSRQKGIDIEELLALVEHAQTSVLFAMFMPGPDVFDAVMARKGTCFVRGVANTFPARKPAAAGEAMEQLDESQVDVSIADHRGETRLRLKNVQPAAVQPQGIPNSIGDWVSEITRAQFSAIGHAIVHSKVLVIDADGPHPYVVTGSHNFSATASAKNDENFVVIRGNRALAQAYAVNCLALYDHYRWRESVVNALKAGRKPWQYGDDLGNTQWLSSCLESHSDFLKFMGV